MTELVRYEVGGDVATVTLDSPHNRNALSAQLVSELAARLAEAGEDPTSRAVVLTHTGRVFCAGADLKAAGTGSTADSGAAVMALLTAITELPKPVIARIAGHLGMPQDKFIAAYLERDEEEARYRIKTTPCPFLGEDSKCTIYDVRPEKCQGYPFTDKPDFTLSTINHANNAVVCPAVFYLVEQMKRRLGR